MMKTGAIHTSKKVARLRLQMQRTDALQHAASVRMDRAENEYRRARLAWEDAVVAYLAALEELVDPS